MVNNNPKLKLLYLADIFRRETDEDHPLSVSELIQKLSEYGITVSRQTLYEDIELLKDYGMDIFVEKNTGAANLYNLASRDFELPELKLLVDTIQFSQLVTPNKSKELIRKLSRFTSEHQAKQLERLIIVTDRLKGLNESVYYTIDAIHNAVLQKQKITFKYFNHGIDKKKIYRNDGKPYIVSPYTLACSNNNYYLIAFHEKYEDLSQFRIDRMEKIMVTNEPRRELPKDFIMEKYTQKVFSMYNGELKEVELIFDNSLIDAAIDRFGKDMIELKTCYTFSQVPYLTYDVLEEYAEQIVADFAPERLENPGVLDVDRFIEYYLGLSVEYHRICYDRRVLGMTAFDDGRIDVANEDTGLSEPLPIRKGTIVIDTSLTVSKRSIPRLRFTMMHEGAGHWLLHRRAFSADNPFGPAGVYKNQFLAAKEGRDDYSSSKKEKTDNQRMERQADFMSSAVLMPRPALRNTFREFFRFYDDKPRRIIRGASPLDDAYAEQLPEYVAKIYNVSKRAALIRLEKLTAIADGNMWKGVYR